MDAPGAVDRFLDMLTHDSETASLAAVVTPMRGYAGTPEEIYAMLEKLAGMWAAAKGVTV